MSTVSSVPIVESTVTLSDLGDNLSAFVDKSLGEWFEVLMIQSSNVPSEASLEIAINASERTDESLL